MMVLLSALIHLQFIKIVSKFPTIFIGREFVYFVYTTSVRGLGMDEFLLIFITFTPLLIQNVTEPPIGF